MDNPSVQNPTAPAVDPNAVKPEQAPVTEEPVAGGEQPAGPVAGPEPVATPTPAAPTDQPSA